MIVNKTCLRCRLLRFSNGMCNMGKSRKPKTTSQVRTPSKGRTRNAKKEHSVANSKKDAAAKESAIKDVAEEVAAAPADVKDVRPEVLDVGGSIKKNTAPPTPKPKANWSCYRATVKQHFLVVGYSDRSRCVALSRMKLWMKECNIDFYESTQADAARVIADTFVEGARHLSYRDEAKWMVRSTVNNFTSGVVGLVSNGPKLFGLPMALPLIPLAFVAERLVNDEHKYPYVFAEEYEDVCCEHVLKENVEIHASASYDRSVNPVCRPSTYSMTFTTAPSIWVPRNCDHNMEIAVTRRQLLPELSDAETRERFWKQATDAFLKVNPLSYEASESDVSLLDRWLSRYPLSIRPLMAKAWAGPNFDGVLISPRTKAQVKVEVLPGKEVHKMHPRLVSAKTEEYHASFGPEYLDFCKYNIKRLYPSVLASCEQRFIYTGGMNAIQIGEIVAHFEYLGWHVAEGDYSRYDGRNEVEALQAEHEVYRNSGLPLRTCKLIEQQVFTKGKSGNGFRFTVKGKFSSGVNNTSFGNTIRGWIIIAGFFASIGYTRYVVMQLGDDNVIFTEDDEWELDDLIAYALKLGHKLEGVAHGNDKRAYDTLSYCSQIFWDVGVHEGAIRRVMGPKPFRCLGKSFMARKRMHNDELQLHVKGIAEGYKHYDFVPVLNQVCARLRAKIKGSAKQYVDDNPHKVVLNSFVPDVDQDAVNAQFEYLYGMSPYDFDYLRDVPFEKMGRTWFLPGFDEGNMIDGMEGTSGNDFGMLASMMFLGTGSWLSDSKILHKIDTRVVTAKRWLAQQRSGVERRFKRMWRSPVGYRYKGPSLDREPVYDDDGFREILAELGNGFVSADY